MLHDGFCAFALEISTEFSDPTVTRVNNEMKVIWHQHIGDQLCRPAAHE
jgi:hypothetical protein